MSKFLKRAHTENPGGRCLYIPRLDAQTYGDRPGTDANVDDSVGGEWGLHRNRLT